MRRSGRYRVDELLDGSGDPVPGISTILIAVSRELVGALDALFVRLVAIGFSIRLAARQTSISGITRVNFAGLRSINV